MLWLFFFFRGPGTAALATHPSPVVNSTMGGLGRKLTKTTTDRMGVLKCVCFDTCVSIPALWGLKISAVSAICLFVGDNQTSVKKEKKRHLVVIPQQVSISEQSPFSVGNPPPRNIVACFPVLPHTHSREQICSHHNWLSKAIVPVQHQLSRRNKLMHGGSSLTHATCRRREGE